MSHFISIIIPTYNRAHLLGETLESIIDLEYASWECLVIDDGSIDYTPELMEFYSLKDKRIKYLERPASRPKGANACRNYGFEKSSGEYINFFDSDDLIHPAKLNFQLSKLENTSFSFAVSQVNFFLEHKENLIVDWPGKIKANNVIKAYIRGEISWFTPSILWKRKFLQSLDYLFDEELQASQEWEFHIRVLQLDPEYILMEDVLSFIRKHEDNISYNANIARRNWNYFLARFKIYKGFKKYKNDEDDAFLRKYLLDSFKALVRDNNIKAIKAFKIFILPEIGISNRSKIYSLLAILSYKVFKKGNLFLNNVKLER